MSPEELEDARSVLASSHSEGCDISAAAHALLAHVDSITADRDEARQEVAALRAQRDEIREVHRVDEEERDSDALRRMATLAVEAQKKLSTLTEAVAWYLELRARDAGSNGAQAEGYANTLRAAHDDLTSLVDGEPATARAAHLDTLTARLEAAERERGELRAEVVTLRADLEEWRRSHREAESLADQAKRRRERTLETVEARADAAEAKLAAIDAPFLGGALHHIEKLHDDQRESRDREEALVLKLEAAERERDLWRKRVTDAAIGLWRTMKGATPTPEQVAQSEKQLRHDVVNAVCAVHGYQKQHPVLVARYEDEKARADRAEAKLAALVEAHDAWKRYGNPTSPFDLDEAIRAARGPA